RTAHRRSLRDEPRDLAGAHAAGCHPHGMWPCRRRVRSLRRHLHAGRGRRPREDSRERGIRTARKEMGIVQWVWNNRREAGLGTSNLPGGRGLYLPLVAPAAGGEVVGVLGIFPADPGRFTDPEQRRLADALATQTAMAIERARLAEATQRAHVQVE